MVTVVGFKWPVAARNQELTVVASHGGRRQRRGVRRQAWGRACEEHRRYIGADVCFPSRHRLHGGEGDPAASRRPMPTARSGSARQGGPAAASSKAHAARWKGSGGGPQPRTRHVVATNLSVRAPGPTARRPKLPRRSARVTRSTPPPSARARLGLESHRSMPV
jgi:hypothetical protein